MILYFIDNIFKKNMCNNSKLYPKQTFTVLLTLLLNFLEIAYSWKLQLCLNGTKFETTSDSCKYGFWFTQPTVVHKICFEHGVCVLLSRWAIYKEFCEDAPVIWTVRPGIQGCMNHDQLGNRIIGVVPIGQDEHTGAIVATQNRRLFFNNHKLKHGMRVSFLNEPADVEVLTWGPSQVQFSLHQYVNNGKGILQQCLIKGVHAFFGYYKIRLESDKNVSFFLAKNVCYTPLSSQTGEGGRRVQVLPAEIDFDILQSSPEDVEEVMKCEQYVTIDDQFERNMDDISGLVARELDGRILSRSSIHIIERKVDEETHKIALRLLAYQFNNDKFTEHFDSWEFLRVITQIFSKACPESMVPAFFVTQIHLLFQAVLHESSLLFPNHRERDKQTAQRIFRALQMCLENSTTLEFKPGENCTQDAPLLKKTFPNATQYYVLAEMPAFIKVDSTNYDLLMESIWKLMNFAHYYCADHFHAFASDHSQLEEHWAHLFSPLVIRRWKYPGQGYLTFEKIFMSINLERSIRNLDFCVTAARLHSSYKGWLKRPLSHWEKEKQLDTPLHGRSGIEDRDNPFLLWNDKAYCLKDYMDPALKLPHGDSIEKCGIRLPKIPLYPLQLFRDRGNIIL